MGRPGLVREGVTDALGMAGVAPGKCEQAFAGYVNGMSCQGQRALYYMGLGGIPVYNVHSYCSTGSSALHLGYQAVASGMNECVLAFGFEKMEKGPLDSQLTGLKEKYDEEAKKRPPAAAVMFGDGGRHHMELYGTTKEQFAKVSVKNHRHSVNNPRSQYRDACTLEEVLASRLIYDPLTLLQCCPTSDGAGAAILCSEEFAKEHGQSRPVKIIGQARVTPAQRGSRRRVRRHHGQEGLTCGRTTPSRAGRSRSACARSSSPAAAACCPSSSGTRRPTSTRAGTSRRRPATATS